MVEKIKELGMEVKEMDVSATSLRLDRTDKMWLPEPTYLNIKNWFTKRMNESKLEKEKFQNI